MSKEAEIFINSDEANEQTTPEEIKYIHNTESDDYISQFLWEQGSQQMSRAQHDSAPVLLEQINESKDQSQGKRQNYKKKGKRQKSLFHNFQKHLVITLKKIVKIKARAEDGLVGKIAQEMWDIFLKSHLYTKTILHILYGAQQQQEECSFTSSMLNRFGFVDLFNKYSQDIVKDCQKYLRQETIKAVKRVNIRQYLIKRRLSKAEEFEDYLNQFIEELSSGPIKRRIPKQKKKALKSYIQSQKKNKLLPNNQIQQHS